jgi:phosphoserine phosphatase
MSHTHVITLIANPLQAKLDATVLDAVQDTLSDAHIAFDAPQWLAQDEACDIFITAPTPPSKPRCLDSLPIDWAVQSLAHPRKKRLLISDMDSTIIQQECIDELAASIGIGERVALITERAMNGELDFAQALQERVGLLKGLPETALQQVFDTRITLMSGARTLVQTMRAAGAHTMLVSGGFTFFTSRIREACGFHEDEANILGIEAQALTGEVHEPILDKMAKLAALHRGCALHQLQPSDVLAVGDGANDLPMIQAAGLGVGYHGKAIVQQSAQIAINHNDLTALLYLQGYKKEEFKA